MMRNFVGALSLLCRMFSVVTPPNKQSFLFFKYQTTQASKAWKTCIEMLYYCIFSQLRSTCDNCTVTLVVDILGICHSSYSMVLLKNENENYFFYKCNAYHVFHVSLNSAQLVTTAPSRSLSIVRIFRHL